MITYRVDTKRVTTQLFHFTEATVERLRQELEAVATSKIVPAIRASWAGHTKRGDMERSLKVRARVHGIVGSGAFGKGGTSVVTTISAGGTRNAEHAHLFERGFTGTIDVPAHTRDAPEGVGVGNEQRAAGIRVPVQAYQRNVTYAAHDYMRQALDGGESATRAGIERALGQAVQEAGLG